ncbi:MAG: translation initiation factor 2 [Peptococcaceae bacterium]|nr:translation initiation factor 2 [Peptococcaceae bacterium]
MTDELTGVKKELLTVKTKVLELEQRLEHLRVSRRVLMNLLEKAESEKLLLMSQLEKENGKLQRDNRRFAQWILSKNRQIVELQAQCEKRNS